jgi:hypothetical protein
MPLRSNPEEDTMRRSTTFTLAAALLGFAVSPAFAQGPAPAAPSAPAASAPRPAAATPANPGGAVTQTQPAPRREGLGQGQVQGQAARPATPAQPAAPAATPAPRATN